ncbi:HEAT repeat domain-containing protein [Krasilnikovia sp. MM14-A1259]|uniref:HEAT repeat domain-containing protein n=1 Tax=Krasilnikovia sp. MM14-A1259 TaxID=3373539 RepID=UPI003812CE9A
MISDDPEGHGHLQTLARTHDPSDLRDLRPVDEDLSAQVPHLIQAFSFKPIGTGLKRTQPGRWAAETLLFCLRRCSGPWLDDLAEALGHAERGTDALQSRWASYVLTCENFRRGEWAAIDARCADPSPNVRLGAQDALHSGISQTYHQHSRRTRTVTPPSFDVGPVIAPLTTGLRDSKVDVRKSAASALRDLAYWLRVDPTPFAPELGNLLRDRNTEVVKDAAEVFGRLPNDGQHNDLAALVIALLEHPNSKVRQQAMAAIASSAHRAALYLPYLPQWFGSDDQAIKLDLGFLVRRLAQAGADISASVPLITAAIGRYGPVADKVFSETLVTFGGTSADRRGAVLAAVRSAAPRKAAQSIARQLA